MALKEPMSSSDQSARSYALVEHSLREVQAETLIGATPRGLSRSSRQVWTWAVGGLIVVGLLVLSFEVFQASRLQRNAGMKDGFNEPLNKHPKELLMNGKEETKAKEDPNTVVRASNISYPSLFCFSVMLPNSDEQVLLKALFKKRLGIFACDASSVASSEKVQLGSDSDPLYTMQLPPEIWTHKTGDPAKHPWHATTSWLNAGVFMVAFDYLIGTGALWEYDWLAKADPDAVFFPDRLRKHVGTFSPEKPLYFRNCNKKGDKFVVDQSSHHGGSLYGALEVFSMKAMKDFRDKDGKKTCEKQLHWPGWGEDFFMQECMEFIGIPSTSDFYLVGDERCNPESCKDGWRAAFHPYKDEKSYLKCWQESAGSLS